MGKSTATWIHEPRQSRSQDTTNRILRTVSRLMEKRDLDSIAIAEIARAAKVSVGGFYARFPSKAALLHAFDEFIVDLALQEIRRKITPERLADADVRGVVRAYVRMAVAFFSKHRRVMRQIYLQSRTTTDARYVARTEAFNAEAHGRLTGLLLARREEIRHPDPEKACTFGVMMVSAAMRESILFTDRKMNLSTLAGRALCDELTRAFCAYLGAPVER